MNPVMFHVKPRIDIAMMRCSTSHQGHDHRNQYIAHEEA